MVLPWCSANAKATSIQCEIQKPCGLENCKEQCHGLCEASGGHYPFCEPLGGVCKCTKLRTGVPHSLP